MYKYIHNKSFQCGVFFNCKEDLSLVAEKSLFFFKQLI